MKTDPSNKSPMMVPAAPKQADPINLDIWGFKRNLWIQWKFIQNYLILVGSLNTRKAKNPSATRR